MKRKLKCQILIQLLNQAPISTEAKEGIHSAAVFFWGILGIYAETMNQEFKS